MFDSSSCDAGPPIRQGSTVVVGGSTSLALATLVRSMASKQQAWCAAIGFPSLGLLAAEQQGLELARFPLVPCPGKQWAVVTAALLAEFDAVLLHPPFTVRHDEARRLSARARERNAVLIVLLDDVLEWPQADLRLRCVGIQWDGLFSGYGRLRQQRVRVCTSGKGAASIPTEQWIPLAS